MLRDALRLQAGQDTLKLAGTSKAVMNYQIDSRQCYDEVQYHRERWGCYQVNIHVIAC